MFTKLEHVALSVKDIERSIEFYRDVIGFEVKMRLEPDPKLPQEKVVALKGAAPRIAHLYLGGFMLELFQYLSPVGRPIPRILPRRTTVSPTSPLPPPIPGPTTSTWWKKA